MDTPETQNNLEALLRENIAVTKENNQILRDMRRIGRIAFWSKVVIWTLLIVVPLLFLGPILQSLFSVVSPSTAQTIMGLPSAELIQQAIEAYSGQME